MITRRFIGWSTFTSAVLTLATIAGCGGSPPPPPQTPPVARAQQPAPQPAVPPDAILPTTDAQQFSQRLFGLMTQLGYQCRPEPDEPAVTIFCERRDRFRTFLRYTVSRVARLVLSVRFQLRTDCGNITPLVNSTNYEYNATTFTCRDDVLESRSVLLIPQQGLTASVLDLYLGWWAEMTREQARVTGLMGFVE